MEKPEEVVFHYLKSPHFKSFYSTGAYGGISPNGLISMAFFIERSPIPQKAVYAVDDKTGTIGEELIEKKISKEGIIREVDCNILMDITTAKTIRDWLDNNIKNFEDFDNKHSKA